MDQKTIVHVGTEIALIGSLFYYTYKMNNQLQLQVNQLREELNDLRDYIDHNQLSSGTRSSESDLSAKQIQQMIHSYIDQKQADFNKDSLQNQIDELKSKLSNASPPVTQMYQPTYPTFHPSPLPVQSAVSSQPTNLLHQPTGQSFGSPPIMTEQQLRLLASQRSSEQEKLAEQQRLLEQQRQMEQQRLADQQRQMEQQRLADQQRQMEQQRLADQQRQMEQQRLADQQRQMEQQRMADQQRQMEQQRMVEPQRRNIDTVLQSSLLPTGFQPTIPLVTSVVHMQHFPAKSSQVSSMVIEEETSDNEDFPLIDEIEIDAEIAEELEKIEKQVGKNSVSRSKTKTPKKSKSKSSKK